MSADIKHEKSVNDRETARPPEPAHAHTAGSYDPPAQSSEGGTTISEAAGIDDVLDVEGATRLLRIGRNTIYELVGRNEIPHRRLGKQIRFSRAAIMRWLDPWSSQDAKKGNDNACTTRSQNGRLVLPDYRQDPRWQEAAPLRYARCSRTVLGSRSDQDRGARGRATRDQERVRRGHRRGNAAGREGGANV